MRWAVTTTAGRWKPASLPSGEPRSMSTTSPEVSIEPLDLVVGQYGREVLSYLILMQPPHGKGDRLANGGPQVGSEALQFVMGGAVDSNARTLGVSMMSRVNVAAAARVGARWKKGLASFVTS